MSPFVDTLDDAVYVVDASAGGVSAFGAVALLLDADDRLLTAVECPRCDTPERAVEFCSVLLAAASPDGAWQRLVLATSSYATPASWAALVTAVGPSCVDLVDWLSVDVTAGSARSACHAFDGRDPW